MLDVQIILTGSFIQVYLHSFHICLGSVTEMTIVLAINKTVNI